MGNSQSNTLHEAAANNDLEKAQKFIREEHRDVNEKDKNGWAPVHFAAYGGSLDVLNELLAYGADPGAADESGRTALHLAALRGNKDVAELLLKTPSVHVDARDSTGMTPLHKAAGTGSLGVAEVLIAKLADINARLPDGSTPVHWAASKGHDNVLKLLLLKGADFKTPRDDGQTPLHEAAEGGHLEVVRLLLSVGADSKLQDKEGNTAADIAKKNGHSGIATLISNGVTHFPLTPPRLGAAKPAGGPAPSAPPMPLQEVFFSAEDLAKGPALPAAAYPQVGAATATLTKPAAPPVGGDKAWWDAKLNKAEGANNVVPFPLGSRQAPAGGAAALDVTAPKTEAEVNAAWWGQALGAEGKDVPTVGEAAAKSALGQAPSVPQPGHPAYGQDLVSESSLNKAWWAANIGKDLGTDPELVVPRTPATTPIEDAAAVELPAEEGKAGNNQPKFQLPGSRQEFEAAVLDKAQSLFKFIQSKVPNNPDFQKKDQKLAGILEASKKAEAAQKGLAVTAPEAEWGQQARETGWGGATDSAVKLDLEPYDDDDYEGGPAQAKQAPAPSKPLSWWEQAALRKKLAKLELEVDHAEGWVRGGSKAEAKAVQEQRAKVKQQQEEIAALKRQLESLTVQAPAKANIPPEYLCPISQTIMADPVVAADGYTYDRGAILTWLRSGATVSPLTGQVLPHPGLTPNNTLRSAINAFQAKAN
eukprot:jgi/Botrbrau1/13828/Bobra.0056s0070.2